MKTSGRILQINKKKKQQYINGGKTSDQLSR